MSQDNLIEQAKQGNPRAIAYVMNSTLQKRGITATVNLRDGCLDVMLDAPQLPDESVAEFIRKGVLNLKSEFIYEAHVYGRIAGEHFSTWVQEFKFKERLVTSTDQTCLSVSGMNQTGSVLVPQATSQNLSLNVSTANGSINVDLAQLLGVVGAFILLLGVFSPIINLPVVGTLNYFRNGTEDGVVLAALAVASLLLTIKRQYAWIWVTGSCSLALVTLSFLIIQNRISEIKSQVSDDLSGNPFRGIADLALQSVQLQWGWVLLFVGSVLIVAAAYLKQQNPTRQTYIKIGAVLALIVALNLGKEGFRQVEYAHQADRARQSEAKVYISAINSAQRAYYLENHTFASNIEALALGLKEETENYSYAISPVEQFKTIATATAKRGGIKSYTGGVFMLAGADGVNTEAILCESDRATKTSPDAPTLDTNKLKCSSGSTEPTSELKE